MRQYAFVDLDVLLMSSLLHICKDFLNTHNIKSIMTEAYSMFGQQQMNG
jgi:hypothetical protein